MTLDFALTRTTNPATAEHLASVLADPGFGQHFTDHMAVATWTLADGWHGAEIKALAPFSMHPAAGVLHYGQEIFEGLKAYRHADGSVWLFRPEANAARFAASAQRLALPVLPVADFVNSVAELVRADEAWVPLANGEQSLYLRPFLFAAEAFLGVRAANEATYAVIASPAGPYFAGGVTGVRLWVSTTYSRAALGGTGEAKCGGNYASSLLAQVEAKEHGCDQVLYLDGVEQRWLEESGTMNLFLVTADGELLTPSLGTILRGVTRDCVLALAAEHNLTATERRISLDELRERVASGHITEIFAAGTAAVITPVVAFEGDGFAAAVGDGAPGAVTLAIREHLLDLQYGRREDTRGWLQRVV